MASIPLYKSMYIFNLILMCLVFPYSFILKSIMLISLTILVLYSCKVDVKFVSLYTLYLSIICAYSVLSISNGFDFKYIIIHAIKLVGFLLFPIISVILFSNRKITVDGILLPFFIGVVLYILIKYTLTVLIVINRDLYETIRSIFPLTAIPIIGGKFPRFFSSNDILIPYAFSLSLMLIKRNKLYLIFSIIFLFAGILSLTRYIWIYILLSWAVYSFLWTRVRFVIVYNFLLLGVIALFLYFVANVGMYVYFEDRLFYEGSKSLNTKYEQAIHLIEKTIENNILFGHGVGSYSEDFIRNHYIPFEYEVQWAAIFFQFGFVGLLTVLIFLVTFLVYPFVKELRRRNFINKRNLYLTFIFFFFLLSGFTNSYLVTSAASVIISLHVMLLYKQ